VSPLFSGKGVTLVAAVDAPEAPQYSDAAVEEIKEGIEEVAIADAAEGEALLPLALSNPFVIVGITVVGVALLAGVAWYAWTQAQNEALKSKAYEKYCSVHNCGVPYTQYENSFEQLGDNCSNPDYKFYYGYYVYGPNSTISIVPPIKEVFVDYPLEYKYYDGNGNLLGWSGEAGPYGCTFLYRTIYTPYSPTAASQFDSLSNDQKHEALGLLSNSDIQPILASSPQGGVLKPGDNLPKGHYSFPSDGSAPSHSPGPETVPDNSSSPPSPSPSPPPPSPSPSPSPSSPPPPPEPEPEPEPGAGGAMQGGGNLNWNWKSVKTFGHTFTTHGQGSKNTKNLAGRAAGTGEAQGQWLDNQKAAQFLQDLRPSINGPTIVEIPPDLGQVILPDGSIIPATHAQVVPTPIGGYKTAYPLVLAL
jgi:hypothetical protein